MTIKQLIDDEIEAIGGYDKAIKETEDESVKTILNQIMMEEYKHISILRSIENGNKH